METNPSLMQFMISILIMSCLILIMNAIISPIIQLYVGNTLSPIIVILFDFIPLICAFLLFERLAGQF
jgi:hypothetical protein